MRVAPLGRRAHAYWRALRARVSVYSRRASNLPFRSAALPICALLVFACVLLVLLSRSNHANALRKEHTRVLFPLLPAGLTNQQQALMEAMAVAAHLGRTLVAVPLQEHNSLHTVPFRHAFALAPPVEGVSDLATPAFLDFTDFQRVCGSTLDVLVRTREFTWPWVGVANRSMWELDEQAYQAEVLNKRGVVHVRRTVKRLSGGENEDTLSSADEVRAAFKDFSGVRCLGVGFFRNLYTFGGVGINHRSQSREHRHLQSLVQLAPPLSARVDAFVRAHPLFVCVHLRTGDFESYCQEMGLQDCFFTPSQVVRFLAAWASDQAHARAQETNADSLLRWADLPSPRPVYLATNIDASDEVEGLLAQEGFQMLRFTPEPDLVGAFGREAVRVSLVERAICARAAYFIGNSKSTWSWHVFDERASLGLPSTYISGMS
mmetsp:Transcript_32074/g.80507  ORF Transcript_32074/g.80507 Transcript_32074/m.80507 type:complete len:433 (+) Transcript_32074:180-1478(+)|eukprot:CAMPEP_0177634336 /NCGR_PEP_ID=MMETSP0447-20121125/3313_1 /TAXON_ID=0 /ORGANISM="Stygamoeba regulata, Strain BSH-02190019" /LENGTH=432 /DNA_ID=CAMNT_0019136049 /DNA_START=105 /DNA_END=1403 /DNA_ORIENTATION=-